MGDFDWDMILFRSFKTRGECHLPEEKKKTRKSIKAKQNTKQIDQPNVQIHSLPALTFKEHKKYSHIRAGLWFASSFKYVYSCFLYIYYHGWIKNIGLWLHFRSLLLSLSFFTGALIAMPLRLVCSCLWADSLDTQKRRKSLSNKAVLVQSQWTMPTIFSSFEDCKSVGIFPEFLLIIASWISRTHHASDF